ncbi:MAG: serine/threonine protein kinase [Deltaproteobacteria bacterium]|nr:serine/threonine protein kinase [Deltaproteobacteria bacterium]
MAFDGPLLAGRFRLGPRLGRGSQAETFIARDEKEKTEVVVKRLKLTGAWKQFDLLEREAKVLGQLRHPGIPRYLQTIEEPVGTFNLVMQRMPGEDLRELTARRRLSMIELRDVLVRALELCDYLHARTPPVIHRDIKPSNLVRAPDGKLALVDFGGVLDAARERGGSTMVGTFGYMAPEQLHGQCTPATDLFALGATIVALAGGVEPEDVPRKGLRMDLAKHLPALDPDLRAALAAMTEPEPEKRPQRARDVIKLLADPRRAAPERALSTIAPATPARHRNPARMFAALPEPLGALVRLGVVGFSVSGWVAMLGLRFALFMMTWWVLVLPARRRPSVRESVRDVDQLLGDGQHGFTDLARAALRRSDRPALPPGES